jgi:hypothetical protein
MIEAQVSETSPEDFLHKRSLSYNTKTGAANDSPQTNVEQLPSAGSVPDKTGSPSGKSSPTELTAAAPNGVESSPRRKSSFVEDIDGANKASPAVTKVTMINRKENGPKPLTSANIKGPEDFEMFVQSADTVKYTLTPENVRDDPVSVPRCMSTFLC